MTASPAPSASPAPEDPAQTARARAEFLAWQTGKIDRSHYSATANAGLTDAVIAQVSPQLAAAGTLTTFTYTKTAPYSGMNLYFYMATCSNAKVVMIIGWDGDGKVAGIRFAPGQ